MKPTAIGLMLVMAAAWAVLAAITGHAIATMGVGPAVDVFMGDFAHPWRAQFNADFTIHLVLIALWMLWRSRSWPVGLVCAALACNLGGMFTLPYLMLALWTAKGNLGAAFAGRHWPARS